MLESKIYYYKIKIKDVLDIVKLNFLMLINFFIKEASSINACLIIFIIKINLVKDSIKKKILLMIRIDFGSKT